MLVEKQATTVNLSVPCIHTVRMYMKCIYCNAREMSQFLGTYESIFAAVAKSRPVHFYGSHLKTSCEWQLQHQLAKHYSISLSLAPPSPLPLSRSPPPPPPPPTHTHTAGRLRGRGGGTQSVADSTQEEDGETRPGTERPQTAPRVSTGSQRRAGEKTEKVSWFWFSPDKRRGGKRGGEGRGGEGIKLSHHIKFVHNKCPSFLSLSIPRCRRFDSELSSAKEGAVQERQEKEKLAQGRHNLRSDLDELSAKLKETQEELEKANQEREDLQTELLQQTSAASTESEVTSLKRMKRELETKLEGMEDDLDEANIK